MNAYNPLTSMKRLEASGLERRHAEAIASEIDDGIRDVVTKSMLDEALEAALNRQIIKLGVLIAAIVALACSVMGVVFTIS